MQHVVFFFGWLLDVLIPDVPEEVEIPGDKAPEIPGEAGASRGKSNRLHETLEARGVVASCLVPAFDHRTQSPQKHNPTVFNPKFRPINTLELSYRQTTTSD